MGLMNLLFTGIFFPDTSDLPMFGYGEKVLRAQLHQRANDVGTSRYGTFMTDPQLAPAFEAKGPGYYSSVAFAKPIVNSPSSINYINQNNELLGGIFNLTQSERMALAAKHMLGK